MAQKNATVEFNMDSRPTRTVTLPSFPGSEVVVFTSLMVSEQREIEKKYQLTDGTLDKDRSAELGFEMVAKTIKSWNFVVNKQPMEVTAEILGQFPMIDFIILQEAVTGKKLTHKNSDGSLAIGAGDDTDAKKK